MNNRLLTQTNYSLLKVLLPALYLVLGFILGLFSTVFAEHRQRRRRRIEFRDGMRAELKQALVMLSCYAFQFDYKITKEKLRVILDLFREFNLHEEAVPLAQNPEFKELINKNFADEQLISFAAIHNQKKNFERDDIYSTIRKIHCSFIQGNVASISLLNKSERSLLFNILRRLNITNDQIHRLDFIFEKSYDPNISSENRERLKLNYKNSCQFISDWSYIAAEEIGLLLRQ